MQVQVDYKIFIYYLNSEMLKKMFSIFYMLKYLLFQQLANESKTKHVSKLFKSVYFRDKYITTNGQLIVKH